MDIKAKDSQSSDESSEENPNLIITITMKKVESASTPSSDKNNNDGSAKSVKNSSSAREFCKSLFNKTPSNSDKNNNQSPPVINQYTKVTVDGLMSQISLHSNHQLMNHGNAAAVNQLEANKRYNPTPDENRSDDADELARLQRAIVIEEGNPLEAFLRPEGSSSSSPLLIQRSDVTQPQRASQPSCAKCQQDQNQLKQFGIAATTILPLADGEVPKFHSQDYYCHFLVPDLEKITACCYYWGKMDRYEAEKLLEGKPEGTFLLRDSAQDDFLFSVSFRKYGRSLHARIEQFNQKFSFDSHDPSVYTASTVTGLVEHYKDPTSVMFFEPMLTSPLHRNYVFSLQQLCRAAIVSHTTYDGINELCLPAPMKSYLKEYHFKLKVRVLQFLEGMTNLPSSS